MQLICDNQIWAEILRISAKNSIRGHLRLPLWGIPPRYELPCPLIKRYHHHYLTIFIIITTTIKPIIIIIIFIIILKIIIIIIIIAIIIIIVIIVIIIVTIIILLLSSLSVGGTHASDSVPNVRFSMFIFCYVFTK